MTTIPNWFVCVMGMGTVFISLLILVVVCKILGVLCKSLGNNSENNAQANNAAPVAPAAAPAPAVIENRGEFVAAVSAALAEELGTDVTGIRILSIKKVR